jgi:hypothetical protein
MISTGNRGHWILGGVILLVVGFVAVRMFYSLTPPRHADHDHAIASIDASGFLRVEAPDGSRRNLVGRPGRVLILHFFDPASPGAEPAEAARFAARSRDPGVEVVFVARGESWEGLRPQAAAAGIPSGQLYLDRGGKTSKLFGVRRWPETLIYDARGLLAYQARGPVIWSSAGLAAEIERAKAGVSEVD